MSDEPREEIKAGDRVLCRTAFDEWVPMVAHSGPRVDFEHATPRSRAYRSISVTGGGWDSPVNWPVEDVRPAPPSEGPTP